MPLRVYLPSPPPESVLPCLRKTLEPEIALSVGPRAPQSYHVLIAGQPTEDQLAHSPDLQTLVIPYAGLPEATRLLLRQFPQIRVCNLHHNAVGTAEMGMALLLAAAKRVLVLDKDLRDGDWTRRYAPSSSLLLRGKQSLILGYGAIGRRIAELCTAFGMQVRALRRKEERLCENDVLVSPIIELHSQLPGTDVLFICTPLTSQTRGLIASKELALLPSHSILVNIARGPIVEERSLFEALKNGRLGAAGLDVWYHYPQSEQDRRNTNPSSFPFHQLDNVVMTPHVGGDWDGVEEDRMEHLASLLNALAADEEINSWVDPEAGY